MKTLFTVLQLVISLLLVALVLIQGKGTGLGKSVNLGDSYHTKKGIEKALFNSTIFITGAFLIVSLVNAFFL